ncbi:MAG TPA: DinB family protein [Thermomicrobiaceae bacterium]|nr:DinB family protein [Thermomicrobiaceae bacterium]
MTTTGTARDGYRAELLAVYRATPTTLAALLRQVRAADEARVGGEDEEAWSIVEVVCHLRDAEARVLERVRAMLERDRPELAAYDQAALAESANYRAQSLPEASADFARLRAEQIALLSALTPEQWERAGLHEESGPITIESLTAHMAAHDAIHLAQIAGRLLNQSI